MSCFTTPPLCSRHCVLLLYTHDIAFDVEYSASAPLVASCIAMLRKAEPQAEPGFSDGSYWRLPSFDHSDPTGCNQSVADLAHESLTGWLWPG